MTKETDSVAAKKRKTENPETPNDSDEKKPVKMEIDEKKPGSLSIYQRITSFEEKEALARDPAIDLDQYKLLCKEFCEKINNISDLMSNKPEGWAEEIKERRMEVGLLTVYMKKLNRIEKIRNRNSRENVTKVRQQVDVLQLQLQNLMCEIQHLSREVDKCLLIKSKPLGVDLVPVEEFYSQAPEQVSRPEVTKSDDHLLLLARLEWELQQRKELSVLCSQLEEKKKSLTSLLNKKQCDLDSLAPLIKEVLTVTKPLQEKLGYVASPASLKSERASLLPNCLYFLYVQAAAFREASDDDMITVEINGNDDSAKDVMKQFSYNNESDTNSSGDESEKDEKEPIKKNDTERIERRRRRLLTKHPLTVTLKIVFKDGSCLSLEFAYFLKLNIMTVVPILTLTNNQLKGSEAGEFLRNRDILANLFAGDDGSESPNMSNYYQLYEVGLDSLDTEKLGFPYVWVQKIGGLDFTSVSSINSIVTPKLETAKTSIPVVVKTIRRRVYSRIALVKQIISLENKTVLDPPLMKSIKLSCSIKSWKSVTWEEFRDHPASTHLKDTEYVSPHDIFFQASISRGRAKLLVLVIIKCDYPLLPPLFALQIEWNDSVLNATNSGRVIDMEREVNLYWKELINAPLWASTLLMFQIHRIMVNFDIFLECMDPAKYTAEKKTFLHSHRGRNRLHPYKYVEVGEGVFLQR